METINNLFKRIYVNFNKDKVFVWSSEKIKDDLNSRAKPEIWNIQTTLNYLNWLEQNEQNS